MSIKEREARFLRETFTGVQHTTLNPEGPGGVELETSGTEKDIELMRKLLETDKMGS